ncbi:MAG TPA: hypothetical protein VLI06_18080 [Solimonas sp.]|nr:hypothetical protein [Solimonas sp.]
MAGWRHWIEEFRLARRVVYGPRNPAPSGCAPVFLIIVIAIASAIPTALFAADVLNRLFNPLLAFEELRVSSGILIDARESTKIGKARRTGWVVLQEAGAERRYRIRLSKNEAESLQAHKGERVEFRWEYEVPFPLRGLPGRALRHMEVRQAPVVNYQSYVDSWERMRRGAASSWWVVPIWVVIIGMAWWRARHALWRGEHRMPPPVEAEDAVPAIAPGAVRHVRPKDGLGRLPP